MNTARRDFLKMFGCGAAAAATSAALPVWAKGVEPIVKPRLDPDLTLFFSDSHVNGHFDKYEQHEKDSLEQTVKRIMRLDPLPARAIHFGDSSYLWGHREDYALFKKIVKPLTDAGIKLTMAMGNHDRRSAFLEVFPEYVKSTKIPGRIVSIVDAGHVDFLILDGLRGKDDRDPLDMGPGNGELCKAQQEFLIEELPKWKKPVFVCSHWRTGDFKIGKKLKFHKFLIDQPMVAGYIHGHDHRWRKDFAHESWSSPRILKTLSLPSTGHWGDVGFALMRTNGDTAKVSLHQHDFYFPRPDPQKPGENRALWRMNIKENKGLTCSFTLPKV